MAKLALKRNDGREVVTDGQSTLGMELNKFPH